MVNSKVTIVALSVDTRYAVLYLQDGSTITVKQGDPRLPVIVAQAKAQKLGNGSDEAIVDLAEITVKRTEFADAEKGTKGLVKFFRVARKFVKNLLDTESPEKVEEEAAHVSPLEIGVKPGSKVTVDVIDNVEEYAQARNEAQQSATVITDKVDPEEPLKPVEPTNDQKIDAARERLNLISGNGVDTDHDDFHKPLDEKEETIVAVNTQTGSVIPDAQKLTRQLRQSAKLQNYAGFENLIRRLEHVIHDRGHSVEDLMKFIEHGDLPIADDGCIVIFKRLNKSGDGYVDVHSGRIKQRVGSYVFMRPGLVDPNRRQDCSNGLHVASLSYLSNFSGSVTIMAKVRPEDVFAVPQYSHNKMRVCGYHIIAELPSELRALVNSGKAITGLPAGKALLHDVLRGNHIAVTQHVEVRGQNGADVVITNVKAETADQAVKSIVGSSDVLDMSEGLEPVAKQSEPVKPTDLVEPKQEEAPMAKVKKTAKPKGKAAKAKAPAKVYTKSGAMLATFNGLQDAKTSDVAHEMAQKILAMKSGAKKGWDKLGFTVEEVNFVMGSLRKQSNPKAEAMLEAQKKAEKRKESGRAKSGSPATLIRELLDQAPLNKAQYEAILLLKKKAKKGWAALGVTPSEQADIEQNTK